MISAWNYRKKSKSAMSEIEVTDNLLANGNRLMDLSLPDNTLVVMVKRGNNFYPKRRYRFRYR